jgi:hypothetical protein
MSINGNHKRRESTSSPYTTSNTYEFNLSDFEDCFIVAAHAEVHKLDGNGNVIQSETAWSDGTEFNGQGSWASYADYCKQECPACEYTTAVTALYGGQTIDVGQMLITNDAANLYVPYTTSGGWFLDETHLYAGPLSGMPKNKSNVPIPGQFPYSQDHGKGVTSFTYTIPLSGLQSCYVIASHAVVYKPVGGQTLQTETAWGFGTKFPNTNRWGWYYEYCTQVCE